MCADSKDIDFSAIRICVLVAFDDFPVSIYGSI
jgi:hypothetical protein